jgi:hypothetical protein
MVADGILPESQSGLELHVMGDATMGDATMEDAVMEDSMMEDTARAEITKGKAPIGKEKCYLLQLPNELLVEIVLKVS